MIKLFLLLLVACGEESKRDSEPKTIEESNYASCSVHIDQPREYGFCLYSKSTRIPTVDRLTAYCDKLGEWAGECRYNWVSARIVPNSGFSTEQLLNICGDHNDCGFKVIDARHQDDLFTVFDLCVKHATKYQNECKMHAVQRWWRAKPTEDDISRMLTLKTIPSADLPKYMAYVVQCDGVGKCDSKGKISQECNRYINQIIMSKLHCPSRNPNPEGRSKARGPKNNFR